MSSFPIAVTLSILAFLVSCGALVVVIVLAREVGVILVRIGPSRPLITPSEGADIGVHLDGSVTFLNGETMPLSMPRKVQLVLLFTSPGCVICERLEPDLISLAKSYRSSVEFVIVSRQFENDTDRALALRLENTSVRGVACNPDLHMRLNVRGTPFALILDRDGAVAGRGAVSNGEQLESMLGIEIHHRRPVALAQVTNEATNSATQGGAF